MSDLKRFLDIDDEIYERALKEINNGLKESHWMWYIFPQIFGLGESYTSVFYSIKDLDDDGIDFFDEKIFGDVLDKYYEGERDEKTLLLCDHHKRR